MNVNANVKSPLKPAPKKQFRLDTEDDQQNIENSDIANRRWKYILSKISFQPDPPEYYRSENFKELTLKPGINFWRTLAMSRLSLD